MIPEIISIGGYIDIIMMISLYILIVISTLKLSLKPFLIPNYSSPFKKDLMPSIIVNTVF